MPLKLYIGTQGELAPSHTLWVGEGWVRGCTCSHCDCAHQSQTCIILTANGMGHYKPHPHSTFHVA
jgi:hypothetical protein